jgi:hypothetical protein
VVHHCLSTVAEWRITWFLMLNMRARSVCVCVCVCDGYVCVCVCERERERGCVLPPTHEQTPPLSSTASVVNTHIIFVTGTTPVQGLRARYNTRSIVEHQHPVSQDLCLYDPCADTSPREQVRVHPCTQCPPTRRRRPSKTSTPPQCTTDRQSSAHRPSCA